jgi:hypothetical protein
MNIAAASYSRYWDSHGRSDENIKKPLHGNHTINVYICAHAHTNTPPPFYHLLVASIVMIQVL